MAPFIVYHATRSACRDSIQKLGLLPNRSNLGQPLGVFVYNNDWLHPGLHHTLWDHHPEQDLWEVAYIGPAVEDKYVLNALVLLGPVDHVRLVEHAS